MPTIDIYPVSERDPMPEPQLLRYPVGDQHEKSLPRIWSITATLVSVFYKKVILKGFEATLLTFKKESGTR